MSDLVYETKNPGIIRRVIRHYDVRDFMFLEPVNGELIFDLEKINSNDITIYAMRHELKLAGIGIFSKVENKIFIDIAFFPEFRGKVAISLATTGLKDYINKYQPAEIFGKINVINKRSLRFAQWMGFEVYDGDEKYHFIRKRCNG